MQPQSSPRRHANTQLHARTIKTDLLVNMPPHVHSSLLVDSRELCGGTVRWLGSHLRGGRGDKIGS